MHENCLIKTHLCFIHHFVCILQVKEASSYYILTTCQPYKNKMYLESGDFCQQTLNLCGNDLARVPTKSPRTDSLTHENFVPQIQIRSIVLSRNTQADNGFVGLIHICSNSQKQIWMGMSCDYIIHKNFVCLYRHISSISVVFLDLFLASLPDFQLELPVQFSQEH